MVQHRWIGIKLLPYRIKLILRGIKWLSRGAPSIYYEGYHCGCCGKWWGIPFVVSEFDSAGEWWDTWGLCPQGKGCNTAKEDS